MFTGKFPCNVDQATRFAALYLQATTGDISTKNYVNEYVYVYKQKFIYKAKLIFNINTILFFRKNVSLYIAQDSAGGKQLAKEINLIHASLSGKNALQVLLFSIFLFAILLIFYFIV